jgi:hypothetical protein
MLDSDPTRRLGAPLRSLRLPRQWLLCPGQRPRPPTQVARVLDDLTGGQHGQAGQAKVDPDIVGALGQRCVGHLDHKRRVVPAAGSLNTARTRRQGRTRDHTSRTSPTFATRTPPVLTAKPLRVSRIEARCGPYAHRTGSRISSGRHGARPDTLHQSHRRDPAQPPTLRVWSWPRVTTLGCTCESLIFSPAA